MKNNTIITMENFEGFKIESKFSGTKNSMLEQDSVSRHHEVTLTNISTGKNLVFDVWTDTNESLINAEAQLKDTLYVFLDACLVGYAIYEEHCHEVGRDTNDESKAIYDKCVEYLQQMEKIYDGDLCDLHCEVSEQVNIWTKMVVLQF